MLAATASFGLYPAKSISKKTDGNRPKSAEGVVCLEIHNRKEVIKMSDETIIETPVVVQEDQPTDTSTESAPKNNKSQPVDPPAPADPAPTPSVQVDEVVNPTKPKVEELGLMKTRYTYDIQDGKDKYKSVVTISVICDDPERVSAKVIYVVAQNIGDPQRYICVLQKIEVLE